MKMFKKLLFAAAMCMGLAACSGSGSDKTAADQDSTDSITEMTPADTTTAKVEFVTTEGNFTVLLYGDTPKHRDNFLKLVNNHQYDSLLFHRVIKNFMVQAGDPDSKNAPAGAMLGSGDPGYTIEAEINYPKHYHKRGALAAARTGDQINPERRSSGSQFYVVTGAKVDPSQIEGMQMQALFQDFVQENRAEIEKLQKARDQKGLEALQGKFEKWAKEQIEKGDTPISPEMVEAYTTVGGAPHLDGQYTVFGEVISGMETIDKIEAAATDRNDRPTTDVRILSAKVIE